MKMKKITILALLAAVLGMTAAAYQPALPECASEKTVHTSDAVLEETSPYGELIWGETFDTAPAAESGKYLSGAFPAEFGGEMVMMYNGGIAGMEYALTDTFGDGNLMLSLGGAVQYPQVMLRAFTVKVPGTYTLQFDYYVPSSLHLDFLQAGFSGADRVTVSYGSKTTVTVQKKLLSDESFSDIRIQACKNASVATPYYIDNVRVYYKAPSVRVPVIVLYGEDITDEYETFDAAEDDVITLPDVEAYAGYIPDGCFFAGFSVGEGYAKPGGKYTVTAADIECGRVYAIPDFREIPEPEYGTPIFFEDFLSYPGGTFDAGQSLGKVPSDFGSGPYSVYAVGTASSYSVTNIDDIPMLGISGTFMYPQMRLASLNITKSGQYTLTCDYYVPTDSPIAAINAYIGTQTGVKGFAKGEMKHAAMSYALSHGGSISAICFEGISADASKNGVFYLTNICLYCRELETIPVRIYTDAAATVLYDELDARISDSFTLPTAEDYADCIPDGQMLIGFNVGTRRADAGELVYVTEADEAAGELIVTPIYGEKPDESLVFAENFTAYLDKDMASGLKIASTPAAFGSGSIVLYNVGTASTYHVSTVSGTPMLGISGAVAYPQLRIASMGITKPGLYTLECDYYIPADSKMTGLNLYVGTQTGAKSFVKGALTHNVMSYQLAEGGSVFFIGIEGINPTAAPCTFYVGNITLRYAELKPVTVTVYRDEDGKQSYTTLEKSLGESFTLPTVSDFAAYIPADMSLLGFDVNGKRVSAGASFTLSDADISAGKVSAVPVFGALPVVGYGELLFFTDLSSTPAETLIFNNGASGTHTAVYANAYISLPNMAVSAPMNEKTFCISRGTNLMSSYVTDLDGNHVIGVDQTGLLPHFGVFGGASNAHQSLGLSEEGIYTVMADFMVPAGYASSVKTFYPRVYFADGTFVNGNIGGVKVEGDTWYTGKITFEHKASDRPIDYILFIAETNSASDGITFYIDNISMSRSASASPVMLNVTSIRTAAPNGLRFLSFINYANRSMASEYGFLVSPDDGTSRDYDTELVLPEGARADDVMVTNDYGVRLISSANYIKNSKDLIYATDDEMLPDGAGCGDGGVYFSAVMAGIPEKGYHTPIMVRPFVKIGDVYVYGSVYGASLYDAANAYKNSASYEENEFVEDILAA